ncbi:MAG: GNAT family N-acetyltransferase [Alphaproteobacteria bacterium]|nr:GNAT family N-acetyltransferase [Alphaproteobacteria bacterium]
MPMITVKEVETADEKEMCLVLRKAVFVEGQKVPLDLDADGFDDEAYHWLAFSDGKPVGTARVLLLDERKIGKVQRVAVLEACRGQGVGRKIMQAIEESKSVSSVTCFKLGAQTHALPFYEKLGYTAYGDEFDDAGIPHRNMKKYRSFPSS